jgi:transcriptional regulator with XRE-family HTH domain
MDTSTKQLIKTLRARGFSQSLLSRMTGIPQPRLSRWESGDVPDAADDSLKLARIVASGVTPDNATEEQKAA